MTTTRPIVCDDLFRMASTNLDPLTKSTNLSFYLTVTYLTRRTPLARAGRAGLCSAQEGAAGRISSYMIGEVEGEAVEWHGHVSALGFQTRAAARPA